MGDWLKYVPIFLNLSHLLPDVQKIAELLGSEAESLLRKWPDIKLHLDRILTDPGVKELLVGKEVTGSDQVRKVQTALTELGFKPVGGADGIFGTETLEVLLQYLGQQLKEKTT